MNNREEKLNKFLQQLNYLEAAEGSFPAENNARGSKKTSARQKRKVWVNAVKDFQNNSGLPVTGRVNMATLQEIEKPRCGNPTISLTESVLMDFISPGWGTPNITYGFDGFGRLGENFVRQAILFALNIWRQAATRLRFDEVPLGLGPMIIFSFRVGAHGDYQNFDGPGGIYAHTFPPTSPIKRGEVHFDDGDDWTRTDFITIAIHEIGHALGLDHSPTSTAQMYFKYQGVRRGLHPEDKVRIRNLYP